MNSTEKQDNKFLIGYMVNPTLNVNKVFRYQVEKFLTYIFHRSTMSGIRNDIKKLFVRYCTINFYENRTTITMKVFRVLSCTCIMS